MEAATQTRIGEGAEPIESMEWLREFGERYLAAWNSGDPTAVAACTHEDVVWIDPALAEPAIGRAAVGDFVREGVAAFPDMTFSELGEPAIADDSRAAYVPWLMTGTNTGPIDPPGFAATGKAIAVKGFDVWQFRDGLIWRYEAIYDFSAMARQLGLLPPRGGLAERAMVRAQRLRSRLPL
ncbi:MAG: ester cyclase [Solirubrobacterales bacterium]